jgi:phosphoglycolate phosphatase-like HAD superfamily hydrolase
MVPKRGVVVFDGDGVIFDTVPGHEEIARICAREFGLEELDVHVGDVRGTFARAGLPANSYERYMEIFSAYEEKHGVRVFPYVNHVLLDLRLCGYMTGIFTNRKLRSHNHKIFSGSGLDYDLIDFFMMYFVSGIEPPEIEKALLPIYTGAPFPKPIGMAAIPLAEKIQDIPGVPASVYYVGDNPLDFEFARRNNFSFIGTLSGFTRTREAWSRCGATNIVPDIRSVVTLLSPPDGA